jgi:hypothetical protein
MAVIYSDWKPIIFLTCFHSVTIYAQVHQMLVELIQYQADELHP